MQQQDNKTYNEESQALDESVKEKQRSHKSDDAKFWRKEIKASIAFYKEEKKAAKSLHKMYDNPHSSFSGMLWSNIETLSPHLFSRVPDVVVQAAKNTNEAVQVLASQIAEKAIQRQIESETFKSAMQALVKGVQLGGIGSIVPFYESYVNYRPTELRVQPSGRNEKNEIVFSDGEEIYEESEVQVKQVTDEEKQAAMQQGISELDPQFPQPYYYVEVELEDGLTEQIKYEYLSYDELLFSREANWEKNWWVAFKRYLYFDEAVEKFGEKKARALTRSFKHVDAEDDRRKEVDFDSEKDVEKKLEVYEIWDKFKKDEDDAQKIRWLTLDNNTDEFLLVEEPQAKLRDFFSMPKPLVLNKKCGKFWGTPPYSFYEKSVKSLDETMRRRTALIDDVILRGVYDQDQTILQEVLDARERTIVPADFFLLVEKGGAKGLNGLFQFVDISATVEQITTLLNIEKEITQDIYEKSGISDIIRGASDPRETATAQEIKGDYASMRLNAHQDSFRSFVRDLVYLTFELICEVFTEESLKEYADIEADPQLFSAAVQLLKVDRDRHLSLELETDSTLAVKEQKQKQDLVSFMEHFSKMLEQTTMLIERFPVEGTFNLVKSLLESLVTKFDLGRDVQNDVTKMMNELIQQKIEQMQQPSQPSAEQLEAQAKEREFTIKEGELAIKQGELQLKSMEVQGQLGVKQEENQIRVAKIDSDNLHKFADRQDGVDKVEVELRKDRGNQ